ncbi:MAG: hypothetical protein ACK53Y_07860, partial [bacterium]
MPVNVFTPPPPPPPPEPARQPCAFKTSNSWVLDGCVAGAPLTNIVITGLTSPSSTNLAHFFPTAARWMTNRTDVSPLLPPPAQATPPPSPQDGGDLCRQLAARGAT